MKFRIRSKLAAALAIPLLALAFGAYWGAVDARNESDHVDAETDRALLALGPGSLGTALQHERAFVSVDLVGLAGQTMLEVDGFAQAAAGVDEAAGELRDALGDFDADVQAAFAPAVDALEGLEATRARYTGFSGPRDLANRQLADELFGEYTAVIDAVFRATSQLATSVDLAELRSGIEIVDAVNRRNEAMARGTRALSMDLLSGARDPVAAQQIAGALGEVRTHQSRIDQLAVGPYEGIEDAAASERLDTAIALVEGYLAGSTPELGDLLAAGGLGDGSIVESATSVLLAEAQDHVDAAASRVRVFVLAAAAVTSLAIIVTYAATTSITRPLRALRREAEEMAHARLPKAVLSILEAPPGADIEIPEAQPISIKTKDEVGDVVRALNKVQTRALALAADQAMLRRNFADSFVNLGRRNQLLLDRQLEFITDLEEHETDPEQLDALFKLDHLATRMRRNAESLLVLAGAGSPRQWDRPVPLGDVVRAGLGEVEQYQRVTIRHLDEARIDGSVAAAFGHIVAELAENALSFSPPAESVELKGRWSGRDYVVAIVDNGIGMSADDLARANRRLSGEETYTVAPSRYLGHYVAGRLAEQFGIRIELRDDPGGGLVATVTLPSTVLANAPAVDVTPIPTAEAAPQPDPTVPDPVRLDPAPPDPAVPDPVSLGSVGDAPSDQSSWLTDVEEPATLSRGPAIQSHELASWLASSMGTPEDDDAAPLTGRPDRATEPAHEHARPEPEPVDEDTVVAHAPVDETAPPRIDWMAADAWDDGTAAETDAATETPRTAPPEATPMSPAESLRASADRLRGGAAPAAGETTPSGLPRRVPGANRPGASPLADRGRLAEAGENAAPAGDGLPSSGPSSGGDGFAAAGALGFLQAFNDDHRTTEGNEEDR